MTVILTAMNRFINEADGSQTAFLDGNQPDRVCAPIAEHVRAAGGDVLVEKPLDRIEVAEDGSIATTSFDTLALTTLSLRPIDFTRQQKATEEMDYAELADHIERTTLNGEDATRHRVDLHLKVAFPLTSFIIIALGATLGANARRTGLANSFGLGVLLCFAYYSCVKAGQALGWNQLLAPWLGAWIANLLFAGLALVLLWRAHK